MSNKPSQMLQAQYDENMQRTHAFGVNTPEGPFNRRLMIFFATCAVEPIMHFNGLYHHWPSIPHICSSLVVACLVTLLSVRFVSVLFRKDEDKVKWLFGYSLIFYELEEKNENHKLVLEKYAKILELFKNAYSIIGLLLAFVPNFTAWILSWYFGEYFLAAPIYIPFTDPHTLIGFIANSTILLYYTMVLYITFLSSDLGYIFYVYQCIPMIEIYCMKWQKFGENLMKMKTFVVRRVEPSTSRGARNNWLNAYKKVLKLEETTKVEEMLIILIKEFNSYNDFIEETIKYMELITFAVMTLNSVGIGMSIVVLLHYSKAIGTCMVVYLTFQVLIPCVLGAIITHQKAKFLNELYGFQWYELSLSKQKIFLQFLHLVQNSTEFELPVIGLMDMEFYTNIMNGAYSYFMYVKEFVNL